MEPPECYERRREIRRPVRETPAESGLCPASHVTRSLGNGQQTLITVSQR